MALSVMCQWPERIKKLFQKSEPNKENMYLVKVNRSAKWHPVLLDDLIPIVDQETLEPFVLAPMLHGNGTKIAQEELEGASMKEVMASKEEIEIWPSLVAKALAKTSLNYERMLCKEMRQFFRHLTGMPVRDYSAEKADFKMLRFCFKRQHMMVGKSKPKLISLAKKTSEVGDIGDELLGYWIINHPICLDNGDQWIELVHPFCQTRTPKGKYPSLITP